MLLQFRLAFCFENRPGGLREPVLQKIKRKFVKSWVSHPAIFNLFVQRPSSIRIDQLDRDRLKADESRKTFPKVVHFGIRPAQLSYAGDPK